MSFFKTKTKTKQILGESSAIRAESATNLQENQQDSVKTKQIRNNSQAIREQSAPNSPQSAPNSPQSAPNVVLFVPYFAECQNNLKYKFVKGEAQKWIPISCSLSFRPEFAEHSATTRFIFVGILLLCGTLGTEEISASPKYLANILSVDIRAVEKAIEELTFSKLLIQREEGKEGKERKEHTERTEPAVRVSVYDKNPSQNQNENHPENSIENNQTEIKRKTVNKKENGNRHLSEFSIEDCLKYVESEISKGANIKNANALAKNLFNTGESDLFIKKSLFPEQFERETFGEPILFTDSNCSACFGAKMSNSDGKGYRACEHCKNERGFSTGFELWKVKEGEQND